MFPALKWDGNMF